MFQHFLKLRMTGARDATQHALEGTGKQDENEADTGNTSATLGSPQPCITCRTEYSTAISQPLCSSMHLAGKHSLPHACKQVIRTCAAPDYNSTTYRCHPLFCRPYCTCMHPWCSAECTMQRIYARAVATSEGKDVCNNAADLQTVAAATAAEERRHKEQQSSCPCSGLIRLVHTDQPNSTQDIKGPLYNVWIPARVITRACLIRTAVRRALLFLVRDAPAV